MILVNYTPDDEKILKTKPSDNVQIAMIRQKIDSVKSGVWAVMIR